jgi:hypothetical protein
MQTQLKGNTMERQTHVDRSSGVISIFRGRPKAAASVYENPAIERFPDDKVLGNAIDNAWTYLENKGHDKNMDKADIAKAFFAAGLFAGMLIMAGIGHMVGLL